jgi:alpha-amylase
MGDDKVTLPDLATDDPVVQSILSNWIKNLVSTYGIDGIRLDAAKHVSNYLADFQKAGESNASKDYF